MTEQTARQPPLRDQYAAEIGRYLSALVVQVAEPCEDGADLDSRLARLDDAQVARLVVALQQACITLGVQP